MASLRGYRALGGSSRRYSTPSGGTISRREYDNLRAQAAGFRNRYEVEKFRTDVIASSRWSNWQYDVKQQTGRLPDWDLYHDVQEVRERREALRQRYPNETGRDLDAHDPALVAANGPLARILDQSGRRPLSGRPVGDS